MKSAFERLIWALAGVKVIPVNRQVILDAVIQRLLAGPVENRINRDGSVPDPRDLHFASRVRFVMHDSRQPKPRTKFSQGAAKRSNFGGLLKLIEISPTRSRRGKHRSGRSKQLDRKVVLALFDKLKRRGSLMT